mgnify:CR=1 FL=1
MRLWPPEGFAIFRDSPGPSEAFRGKGGDSETDTSTIWGTRTAETGSAL